MLLPWTQCRTSSGNLLTQSFKSGRLHQRSPVLQYLRCSQVPDLNRDAPAVTRLLRVATKPALAPAAHPEAVQHLQLQVSCHTEPQPCFAHILCQHLPHQAQNTAVA